MPELLPHQADGLRWLLLHPKCILADAPGYGKTAQALGVVRTMQELFGYLNTLIICPAHLRTNWKREAEMWGIDGNVIVGGKDRQQALSSVTYICSYEWATRYADILNRNEFDIVIIDEAHYLKTTASARTKAILGVRAKGEDCVVDGAHYDIRITGTPAPNHPGEIYPHMRSLAPETLIRDGKVMSKTSFIQRFCKTKNIGHGPQPYAGKTGKPMLELRSRLDPILLRRKSDVKRPPVGMLYLDADIAGRSLLNSIPEDEIKSIRKALANHGLDGLKKAVDHVATLRRLIGVAKIGPFEKHLCEQIDQGGKFVVFAHHREVISGLSEVLCRQKIKHVRLVGGMTDAQKQASIDAFQTHIRCKVIICQNSINTGFTLTASQTLYYLEPSWVPSDNEQMAARIDRIGQTGKVQFRFAALANTIDEQIVKTLAVKLESLKELFG